MKVKCEHCGQKYEIDETMFGEKVQCFVCKKKYIIPAELPEEKKEKSIDALLNKVVFDEDKGKKNNPAETMALSVKNKNTSSKKNNIIKKEDSNVVVTEDLSAKNNEESAVIITEDEPEDINDEKSVKITEEDDIDISLPPKKSILKNKFIIAAIVLVIIVIGVFGYMFLFGAKEVKKQPVKAVSKKVAKSNGVVCNKFSINANLTGNMLNLKLNTDLPGNARLGLYVYRESEGSDDKNYQVPYARRSLNVDSLRKGLRIDLSDKVWTAELNKFLKGLQKLNKDFVFKYFGDEIAVNVYLGLTQANTNFGQRNSKLKGKAVITGRYNTVNSKVEVKYPLPEKLGRTTYDENKYIEIDNLIKSRAYIISRKVPIMPRLQNSENPVRFEEIKTIPAEGYFVVKSKKVTENGVIWYNVDAYDSKDKPLGEGWINSIALERQEITIIK